MKRIFLDTNFIFDYFIRPEFYEISDEFLRKAALKNYSFYVSYLTVANFAYILRKEPKDRMLAQIKKIIANFNIIPNNKSQIQKAVEISAPDFEDILQYESAIENRCDFIITRNEQDFEFSDIPVLSASNFINTYL